MVLLTGEIKECDLEKKAKTSIMSMTQCSGYWPE